MGLRLFESRGQRAAPGRTVASLVARSRSEEFIGPKQGGPAMLVLTRWVEEVIVIDSAIRVTVVSVRGNSVRLGIAVPASVCVDRLAGRQ